MPGDTITTRFHQTVERQGDRAALKHRDGDDWREISWNGYAEAVREVAMGLAALGVSAVVAVVAWLQECGLDAAELTATAPGFQASEWMLT